LGYSLTRWQVSDGWVRSVRERADELWVLGRFDKEVRARTRVGPKHSTQHTHAHVHADAA
jgi:hypothetical protein